MENKGKEYSASEKLDYYKKRAKDPSLSEGQRKFAEKRAASLSSGSSSSGSRSSGKPTGNKSGGAKTYTVTVRPGR